MCTPELRVRWGPSRHRRAEQPVRRRSTTGHATVGFVPTRRRKPLEVDVEQCTSVVATTVAVRGPRSGRRRRRGHRCAVRVPAQVTVGQGTPPAAAEPGDRRAQGEGVRTWRSRRPRTGRPVADRRRRPVRAARAQRGDVDRDRRRRTPRLRRRAWRRRGSRAAPDRAGRRAAGAEPGRAGRRARPGAGRRTGRSGDRGPRSCRWSRCTRWVQESPAPRVRGGGYLATSALPSAATADQLPPTSSPSVSPGAVSSTKR